MVYVHSPRSLAQGAFHFHIILQVNEPAGIDTPCKSVVRPAPTKVVF